MSIEKLKITKEIIKDNSNSNSMFKKCIEISNKYIAVIEKSLFENFISIWEKDKKKG